MWRSFVLFSLATTMLSASPEGFEAIKLVRYIILHPDSWSDLSNESARLKAAENELPKREAKAIRRFRSSLENYGDYFADYPFEMTDESRRSLVAAVRAYEHTFYNLLRERVAAVKDGFDWHVDPHSIAHHYAIYSLDSLGPIFAPYSTKPERPNELAAIVIQVTHTYGAFLAQLMREDPGLPVLPQRVHQNSDEMIIHK